MASVVIIYSSLPVRIPDELELRLPVRKTSVSKTDNQEGVVNSEGGEADTLSLDSDDDPRTKHSSHSPTEASEMEEISDLRRTWNLVKGFVFKLVDAFTEFLENSSVVYRAVVSEINRENTPPTDESQPLTSQATPTYGSTSPQREVAVELHSTSEEPLKQPTSTPANKGGAKSVVFNIRGDTLINELHLAPDDKDQELIESYEDELEVRVKQYSTRPRRLLVALYYMFLSHSDYLVWFLLILNIILNGSVLSLFYAVLIFGWGLLSIPWPTKRFWICLILYTMLVLIVKYGFQFYDLDTVFWSDRFDNATGLYPPRIIGILHHDNFLVNAVWDVLLLISILMHRSLLKVSVRTVEPLFKGLSDERPIAQI